MPGEDHVSKRPRLEPVIPGAGTGTKVVPANQAQVPALPSTNELVGQLRDSISSAQSSVELLESQQRLITALYKVYDEEHSCVLAELRDLHHRHRSAGLFARKPHAEEGGAQTADLQATPAPKDSVKHILSHKSSFSGSSGPGTGRADDASQGTSNQGATYSGQGPLQQGEQALCAGETNATYASVEEELVNSEPVRYEGSTFDQQLRSDAQTGPSPAQASAPRDATLPQVDSSEAVNIEPAAVTMHVDSTGKQPQEAALAPQPEQPGAVRSSMPKDIDGPASATGQAAATTPAPPDALHTTTTTQLTTVLPPPTAYTFTALPASSPLLPPSSDAIIASAAHFQERASAVAAMEALASAFFAARMDVDGALAVLSGSSARYVIRSTVVAIGRGSESKGDVDIDLGREDAAAAQKVCRRQAYIRLQQSGTWTVTNVGRRSIAVEGKQLVRFASAPISHLSLLELGGIPLMFYVNPAAVARVVRRTAALVL